MKALTEKKCPRCAEWIKIEAKVCRFCGETSLPAVPAPRARSSRGWLWGLAILIALGAVSLRDTQPTSGGSTAASAITPVSAVVSDQQIKSEARSISYDLLAREPAKYEGSIVGFRGKVVQVVEDGKDVMLRIDVTEGQYIWKDTVFVNYKRKSDTERRVLTNDFVRFYGKFLGIKSYKSVLGGTIQIPHVRAQILDAT